MNVVFDTGSDWLMIQGSSCSNCVGATFNATKSGNIVSGIQSQRNYGASRLLGYTYKDTVCLTNDIGSCMLNFEYFSITDQVGL